MRFRVSGLGFAGSGVGRLAWDFGMLRFKVVGFGGLSVAEFRV